jgi:hypothetical protein
MSSQRVRCLFCYLETRDAIEASHDHLLSRPVADAFGIDRGAPVARMNTDLSDLRWSQLNGIKRKCVCTSCNNGWMNQLEHGMRSVAEWISGPADEALGAERDLVLRKWALKTHFLLHFIDGNAGSFTEDPTGAVVPPFTAARRMFEGDHEFVRTECGVGVSLSNGTVDFAWAFGHPTIQNPPSAGIPNFTPVSILTLGRLRLWVVTPQLHTPESVAAPSGVVASAAALRPSQLMATVGLPSPDSMTVRYPAA